MLLGFRDRFVPYVEEGSKTHTIRKLRKRPPKVGETCHCYTRLRQKGCRLLGRWPCVKVQRMMIWASCKHDLSDPVMAIALDGKILGPRQANSPVANCTATKTHIRRDRTKRKNGTPDPSPLC